MSGGSGMRFGGSWNIKENSVSEWTIVTSELFGSRAPKADNIKAVKLTDENIQKVAGHILKTLGGAVKVDRLTDTYPAGIFRDNRFVAHVGDWLVETYDYVKNTVVFRRASIEERQKYDLR